MDAEVILIKPAELILKSKGVRKEFERRLLFNIKTCLKQNEVEFDYIIKGQGRYFVYTPEPKEALHLIKNVFGVSNLCATSQVGAEINAIKLSILDLAKELNIKSKNSFGIRAVLVKSSINMSSREIEIEIGSFIQKKTKARVNLSKPDYWLRIEIIGNKAFIYSEIIAGLGGLPLGTAGKIIVLISKKELSE